MANEKRTAREDDRNWIAPAVDIFEDSEAVTLVSDLPGVAPEKLRVGIDHEVLTLEAEADIQFPDGLEAVHVDTPSARYRRTFTLSGDLDAAEISAAMKDGVVTIRIPKRAEAKPRKVAVKVG